MGPVSCAAGRKGASPANLTAPEVYRIRRKLNTLIGRSGRRAYRVDLVRTYHIPADHSRRFQKLGLRGADRTGGRQ